MKPMILVALGGAAGAVGRYKLSGWVLHHSVSWKFPLGTFCVNVLGCLIAGILAGMIAKHDLFSPDTRLLLFTGLLGGFTTFSAFGLETLYLLKRSEHLLAGANVLFSILAAMMALWIGFELAGTGSRP
ncbi:chromosome condensation protein CrcB [Steroidobacter denitrificans]|uniref:Fluoride-specific ion channel FluC n=1 Tax=Steroidobacter denitrificans TaxID=465721 RepID=A0A127F605_STEDE|nr:fluoride efflux transporter CrcB [Steroidobacter denitrificans]AMN45863.1 chromosome condensation protein CrcB [Steroidobacter denitrificans]